jgi:hypothetical protein
MSNVLDKNLVDKVVVMSATHTNENKERLFVCQSGDGCYPDRWCYKIDGYWLSTGERRRWPISGDNDIIRLATAEEIEAKRVLS